jgi:hypothetical protein
LLALFDAKTRQRIATMSKAVVEGSGALPGGGVPGPLLRWAKLQSPVLRLIPIPFPEPGPSAVIRAAFCSGRARVWDENEKLVLPNASTPVHLSYRPPHKALLINANPVAPDEDSPGQAPPTKGALAALVRSKTSSSHDTRKLLNVEVVAS